MAARRLNGGHALWTGDLDGDGEQELAFGWRLKGSMPYDRPGVGVYDPGDGKIQIVDWGGMAAEDLTLKTSTATGVPKSLPPAAPRTTSRSIGTRGRRPNPSSANPRVASARVCENE